jgi:hypothetical protein
MQRKIVVTGCFNCPYCKRKELEYNGGMRVQYLCTHPSHQLQPEPYIPDDVYFTNTQIGREVLKYLPDWCPLPSDNS